MGYKRRRVSVKVVGRYSRGNRYGKKATVPQVKRMIKNQSEQKVATYFGSQTVQQGLPFVVQNVFQGISEGTNYFNRLGRQISVDKLQLNLILGNTLLETNGSIGDIEYRVIGFWSTNFTSATNMTPLGGSTGGAGSYAATYDMFVSQKGTEVYNGSVPAFQQYMVYLVDSKAVKPAYDRVFNVRPTTATSPQGNYFQKVMASVNCRGKKFQYAIDGNGVVSNTPWFYWLVICSNPGTTTSVGTTAIGLYQWESRVFFRDS